MRITDRPQLPMVQGTQQQTATAKTTAAAPTPAPAQANPMDRMFATQFVDAPVARMATAAQDVLPPAQTPLTDERLNRCIDDTFRHVYERYDHKTPQFPTGQQRTEFMNMAKEMRAQGKSARDIEFAIADKLHLVRQGLGDTSEATVNGLIDKTFEFVNKMYGGVDKAPTPEQRTELQKLAKDMSAQGKNGQDIQYAIADKVHSWRRDLGNTSESKINGLIDKTFDYVSKMYGGLAPSPTPEQRNELMTLAKKLSGEGKDAQQIEYAIADKVHTIRQGLDKTDDSALNRFIDEAFKKVFENPNRVPSDRERSAWLKFAQDLAKQGVSGQSIVYALQDGLRTSLHNQ